MKKEIKTYEVQCDGCNRALSKRNVFVNDGSYQSDYLTLGDIDICHHCAGIIFDLNVIDKVSEEKLSEWIEVLRKRTKRDIGILGGLKDSMFPSIADGLTNIGEVYTNGTKDRSPGDEPTRTYDLPKTTGVNEMAFNTTGINEMIPVTSDDLKIPVKTTSSLTNVGDLRNL